MYSKLPEVVMPGHGALSMFFILKVCLSRLLYDQLYAAFISKSKDQIEFIKSTRIRKSESILPILSSSKSLFCTYLFSTLAAIKGIVEYDQ